MHEENERTNEHADDSPDPGKAQHTSDPTSITANKETLDAPCPQEGGKGFDQRPTSSEADVNPTKQLGDDRDSHRD